MRQILDDRGNKYSIVSRGKDLSRPFIIRPSKMEKNFGVERKTGRPQISCDGQVKVIASEAEMFFSRKMTLSLAAWQKKNLFFRTRIFYPLLKIPDLCL